MQEKNLFSNAGVGKKDSSTRENTVKNGEGSEPLSSVSGIIVNKKLEVYLKKYIDSFEELHQKIELKGKLIDLIRKL